MKNIFTFITGTLIFLTLVASAHALPEFSDTVPGKLVMPGGIYFDMPRHMAIAVLNKSHNKVEVYEEAAGYKVTRNGFEESYVVKFICDRVWAISYQVSGPMGDRFKKRVAPFKAAIDKLRDHYIGPMYGELTFRTQLISDENIHLDAFDDYDFVEKTAFIRVEHYWGEFDHPPKANCSAK